jgi:DNA-binding NtrC family response regulator
MATRLLLVDDERNFVEALSRRLVHRGYQVDCCLSGQDALAFLDGNGTDVVLLDIKMPGMDGLETLMRIKEKMPLAETIMLTAQGAVATAVEAMRLGAWDYLMKPCDMEELILKIEGAAKRKKEREQKIFDVRTRPYISEREKEELIARILAS